MEVFGQYSGHTSIQASEEAAAARAASQAAEEAAQQAIQAHMTEIAIQHARAVAAAKAIAAQEKLIAQQNAERAALLAREKEIYAASMKGKADTVANKQAADRAIEAFQQKNVILYQNAIGATEANMQLQEAIAAAKAAAARAAAARASTMKRTTSSVSNSTTTTTTSPPTTTTTNPTTTTTAKPTYTTTTDSSIGATTATPKIGDTGSGTTVIVLAALALIAYMFMKKKR